uniref:Carcinoembryonic antigen-related cell adhesion molecule 1 n=1 Tax=Lygus hesperus TaxID=30085 RepID=A0A0A9YQ67_LYGHE
MRLLAALILHLVLAGSYGIQEPTTDIIGGPDLYIDRGSTINLTCVVLFSPEPPAYIFWNHNDAIISYDSPRGGVSVITEKGETTTSFLLIQHARPSDSGRYQCNPSNAQSKSVNVHVLNDFTTEITSDMPFAETSELEISSTDYPDNFTTDTATEDVLEITTDDDYESTTYESSTLEESTTDYDTSTSESNYETSTTESVIDGVEGLRSKNTG